MKPLLLALILAGCQPVAARTPSAWTSLPLAAFSPYSTKGGVPTNTADPVFMPPAATTEPVPQPSVAPRPTSTPQPTGHLVPPFVAIKGVATFYAYVPGGAAAARALRDAIGPNWRGTRVRVCYAARCVHVVLSDYESSTIPGRLIDLNEASFAALAGPGWYQRGVIPVVVTWGD